jgi:hypothetical protein
MEPASTYYYRKLVELETADGVLSLADCVDQDGELDTDKYGKLLDQEAEVESAEMAWMEALRVSESQEKLETRPTKRQRTRSAKTLRPYYFDDNGQMVFLKPKQTFWYLCYVRNPPTGDERWQAKFRRRFRMPHSEFLVMLGRLADSGKFTRWYGKDAVGNPSSRH